MAFNSVRADLLAPGGQKILTALQRSADLDMFGLDVEPTVLKVAHALPQDQVNGVYPFSVRLPNPGETVRFRSTYGRDQQSLFGPHPSGRREHLYHLKLFVAVVPSSENLQRAAMETLPWNEAVDRVYSNNRTLDGSCHSCWLTGGEWTNIEYADGEWMGWLWDLYIQLNNLMASG